MSNAITGIGTILRRWNGASFDALAEINSISGPGFTRETIEVTSLDSTGGYKEFIAGLKDSGEVSFSMNFTRSSLDLIKADFESDTLGNYEIVLPDTEETSLEFEGLVTELPFTIPTTDKITMDVKIKISGEVTINSGASSGLTV